MTEVPITKKPVQVISVCKQGNLKQKEHHLQYLLLKQRVKIAILCPQRSLFMWPASEYR